MKGRKNLERRLSIFALYQITRKHSQIQMGRQCCPINNSVLMERKERALTLSVPQRPPALTLVRLQPCMGRVYYRKIKMSAPLLMWGCGGEMIWFSHRALTA